MGKVTKISLLHDLSSLKQEIEVGYWPGAALIAQEIAIKASSLGMDKNFQETQRELEKRKMKIQITAGEISRNGNWLKFCEGQGIGYYAMNEGRLESDEVFALTLEQVREYGLRYYVLQEFSYLDGD